MNKNNITRAIDYAYWLVKDAIDADGMPKISHCLRVANNLPTEDQTIAAILHDLVEDKYCSVLDIAINFNSEVAELVDYLTRYNYESWGKYIDRVCTKKDAALIKINDLQDNLQRMVPSKRKNINKYIKAHHQLCEALELEQVINITYKKPIKLLR